MKKEYMKPMMRVIELKKQGCLLSGSNYTPMGSKSVRGLSNDEDLNWYENGFGDEDVDM